MGTRADLGKSWEDIVERWYLGTGPPLPSDVGWEALGALEQLCPQYIDRMLQDGIKAIALIAHGADVGMSLMACQDLPGFQGVLRRMRQGESAAFSEAHFAADLVKAGYSLELEPTLGGKKPDMRVTTGGGPVYVEVVSPEHSQATRDLWDQLTQLAGRLKDENPGVDLEVLLLCDPRADVQEKVSSFFRQISPGDQYGTERIADVALTRYRKHPGPKGKTYTLVHGRELPYLNASGAPSVAVVALHFGPKESTLANVQGLVSDHRIGRLIAGEAHHLSRNERNLLAVDLSGNPGMGRPWIPLIRRALQPRRNRRLGAVIVMDQGPELRVVRRQHWIVLNPYAIRPLPQSLLRAIAALNERSAILPLREEDPR